MRAYKGPRTAAELKKFTETAWKDVTPSPVPAPLGGLYGGEGRVRGEGRGERGEGRGERGEKRSEKQLRKMKTEEGWGRERRG